MHWNFLFFSLPFSKPKEGINKQTTIAETIKASTWELNVLFFNLCIYFFFFFTMLHNDAKNSDESTKNKFWLAGFLFLSSDCETSTFSFLWQSQNSMVPQLVMFHLLQSKWSFHPCVCCSYLYLVYKNLTKPLNIKFKPSLSCIEK